MPARGYVDLVFGPGRGGRAWGATAAAEGVSPHAMVSLVLRRHSAA